MKPEFVLSEKEFMREYVKVYRRKDVKEFIKQDEYLITELTEQLISPDEFWDKRSKLIGKNLK